MATVSASATFKCRKCRTLLFTSKDLSKNHEQGTECSSWYLKDDDMLPWVEVLVDESGWTEGKLYCPRCRGRVGGFDFLHVVHCSCLVDVIPAIWCPKSRVDAFSNLDPRPAQRKALDDGNRCDDASMDGNHSKNDTAGDGLVKSGGFNTESGGDCTNARKCIASKELHNKVEMCNANVTDVASIHKALALDSLPTNCSLHSNTHVTNKEPYVQKKVTCDHDCHRCGSSSIPSVEPGGKYTCDKCICSENIPHNIASESCVTVSHIQQGLKEIRKEVERLCPGKLRDGSHVDEDFECRRRKKPRRRGRGNWQQDSDYVKSFEEIKKKKMDDKSGFENGERSQYHYSSRRSCFNDQKEKELELSDSEIPDFYKCSVCLCLLHEPFKTPCLHVFCALCLRQLNHVSRGRPRCPLCREPIRHVQAEEDLEAEIQVTFPVNYRKRGKEARKNRHRRSALPSPRTTMFDSETADETYEPNSRFIHHVTVVALAVSLLINGVLVNVHGNPAVRVNLQRNVGLFIIIALGCMLASLLLLCLVLFALDFVKVALLLVLSYVAMTKLILRVVLD